MAKDNLMIGDKVRLIVSILLKKSIYGSLSNIKLCHNTKQNTMEASIKRIKERLIIVIIVLLCCSYISVTKMSISPKDFSNTIVEPLCLSEQIRGFVPAVSGLIYFKNTASIEDFKLTVYREYPDKKCTSGYLAVNDKIVCYTVEKPWKDNKENVSSIPAGTYNGKLRYDHNDHWRIELLDVPGRTNIQIHVGNNTDDIKGCILVGERLESNLCAIKGGTSAPAYKKLKSAFYGTDTPTSTPVKNISVEIKDSGVQQ